MAYMLGCCFIGLFEVFPTYFKVSGCNEARPLLHPWFLILTAPRQGGAWEHPAIPFLPGGKHISDCLENRLKNTYNQGRVPALLVSSS